MSKAILVAGLGFGDEGKGTITQYLANEEGAKLIVRYNGGPQAAHNVYSKEGHHHTFSTFGSGTFEGVRTHLSRHVAVDPLSLFHEGRELLEYGIDPYPLLTIDRDALLITPYHWSANRIREYRRGSARHGSCGAGVGEARYDFLTHGKDVAPVMADLDDLPLLEKKLARLQELKLAELGVYTELADPTHQVALERAQAHLRETPEHHISRYQEITSIINLVDSDFVKDYTKGTIVFEGAQGVLLDQDYGFQPHTTWTDITFNNARELLDEIGFTGDVETVGILRTYMTRHGHGPLPTEIESPGVVDRHNSMHLWQRQFRVGYLDLVLLKYALDVLGGVNYLAVTHVDQYKLFPSICESYKTQPGDFSYFEGGRRIVVGAPANYQYQCELAEVLNRVIPQYTDVAPSEAKLEEILDPLRTPIRILSSGPRIKDKVSILKTSRSY